MPAHGNDRNLDGDTAWLPTTPSRTDPPRRGQPCCAVGGGADRAPGGGDQPRRAPRHAAELPAGRDRGPRRARASARQRAARAGARTTRARRCGESCAGSTGSGGPSDGELAGAAARRRRAARARSSPGGRSQRLRDDQDRSRRAARGRCAISVGLASLAEGSTPAGARGGGAARPRAAVALRRQPGGRRERRDIISSRALRIGAVAAAADGRPRPRAARREHAARRDRGARRAARGGRQRQRDPAPADRARAAAARSASSIARASRWRSSAPAAQEAAWLHELGLEARAVLVEPLSMEGHGGGLVIALRTRRRLPRARPRGAERVRGERRAAAGGRALGRDRTPALRHGGARARAHALGAGDPRREHPGHRRAAAAARQRPRHRRPAALSAAVDAVLEGLGHEIDGLRHLITELRPAALDDLGLAAALEALARRAQAIDGLDVTTEIDLGAGMERIGADGSGGWTRSSRAPSTGSPRRPSRTSAATPRRRARS